MLPLKLLTEDTRNKFQQAFKKFILECAKLNTDLS